MTQRYAIDHGQTINDLGQFLNLAEANITNVENLPQIIDRNVAKALEKAKLRITREVFPEGDRHNRLKPAIVKMKSEGVDIEDIREAATFLAKYRCAPPLENMDEINDLVGWAQRKIDDRPGKDQLHIRPLIEFMESSITLRQKDIPPRKKLIEPFFMESSLNMVFAVRGRGKTWFALLLGLALARGHDFLGYKVTRKARVLYIDGEMPLADIKERMERIGATNLENFLLLPSEPLFLYDTPLNLYGVSEQERIFSFLETLKAMDQNPDVLIFDNLSSLSLGADENDNSKQTEFLRFIMQLRHKGYSMLLVHHAGKNGDARGASRKEDLLDTIIKLDEDETVVGADRAGATFKMTFTKTRGESPKPSVLSVRLMPNADGVLEFAYQEGPSMPAQEGRLLRQLHENPNKGNEALGKALGVNKSRISQLFKNLEKEGAIERQKGKPPAITKTGYELLRLYYPGIEIDDEQVEDAEDSIM